MTPTELKKTMESLKWTGVQTAGYLEKSEQTVSNYLNARQNIPKDVEKMLNMALIEAGLI